MTDLTFTSIDNDIQQGPTLYKLDSTGRLRTWAMQIDENGGMYRTLAGLANGKQAVSGWTAVQAKSQNTDAEQAWFEVRAQYKHQLDREYHDSPDTVSQPKMIEPMLAKAYGAWPGPGFAQPKLDGIRCIATSAGLFSRQGQPITAVPHIHAALAPLFVDYPDLVLDGELYNHDLREDFGAISSIVRKKNPSADDLAKAEGVMQYHVYDTVDPDSTFTERQRFVKVALQMLNCGWIVAVPTAWCATEAEANEAYAEAVGLGYEGGMYRLDVPYEIGKRSKALLKRKEFVTREFPIEKLLEGQGNWAGAIKTVVLRNDPEYADVVNPAYGKGRFGAGIRGSLADLRKLVGTELNEKSTATVRYFMLSPDGVPRFPVVIDIQIDGRVD